MDRTIVLLITIVGLTLAATIFFLATARRRDTRRALAVPPGDEKLPATVGATRPGGPERPGQSGEGGPEGPGQSGEGGPERPGQSGGGGPTGREVERAVALERRRVVLPGTTTAPAPAPVPPDEEALGVTRRQVLNRGLVTAMLLGISGFGAAVLAMLWPSLSGGFGSKVRAGKKDEILKQIEDKQEPFYLAAGRFYINPFPVSDVPKAKQISAYSAVIPGYEQGLVALYQKCVHLGCRVPWCRSSQWFECPCHGSQYNRVGEKKGGPAPRGLDRFAVSVDGGTIVVDTSTIITGPPIGTNTTGQEAEGPHCVGGSAEH